MGNKEYVTLLEEVGQLGFGLWAKRPFLEGLADLRTFVGGLLLIRADDRLRELHLPPRGASAANGPPHPT